MSLHNQNNLLSSQLLGALIGVLAALPIAAFTASLFDGSYQLRASIYGGMLLWACVGALLIFLKTYKAPNKTLTKYRVLLWCLSVWIWPLIWWASRAKR